MIIAITRGIKVSEYPEGDLIEAGHKEQRRPAKHGERKSVQSVQAFDETASSGRKERVY